MCSGEHADPPLHRLHCRKSTVRQPTAFSCPDPQGKAFAPPPPIHSTRVSGVWVFRGLGGGGGGLDLGHGSNASATAVGQKRGSASALM